ncbi:catalase family peroxidase [Belnapia sp. T6]|uniref:Catalase-related peroxidase n=1 Tax=Belnapia mucosa TaxID=2804532 RepID=A0ABS1VAQ3_9PROT|nr:catalase family peroxidase [Belnapia mucosa]MBL6457418.1 catalase family peroxidase [Belnapia mucosa]
MTASLRAASIAAVLLSLGVAVPAGAQTPTPAQVIEAFEGVQGPIRTYRPSHPKGACAAGSFEGTAEGARLSVSPTFSGQRIPTVIRFGVGGGPTAADTSRTTRSLSIRFQVPNGTPWDMANISVPIFGAPTPEALVEGLRARRPDPATGRPNQAAIDAFVAANPKTTLQGRWLAANAPPASWATTPYWGVNTFRFRGADGEVRPARWVFEPVAGTQRLSEEQMRSLPADFLAEELRGRVAQAPVAFDMVLIFPQAGDDLNDPTTAWPDDRQRVTVGRLTVTEVAPGPGGACDRISFLALANPPGAEFSDDPTLRARPAPYALSLVKRTRPQ